MMITRLKVKKLVVATFILISGVITVYLYLDVQPWHFKYKGDGMFTDNGVAASSYRYMLRLDTYDLTSASGKKNVYFVGNLPQEDMRLALRFIIDEGESRELIDKLRVRIVVSEVNEYNSSWKYEGVLYSFDAGFTPTSYTHSAEKIVLIMYSREPFTEPIMVFGQPSGLYKQGKRKVEFEFLGPIDKPLLQNRAELIIFGGGWK